MSLVQAWAKEVVRKLNDLVAPQAFRVALGGLDSFAFPPDLPQGRHDTHLPARARTFESRPA